MSETKGAAVEAGFMVEIMTETEIDAALAGLKKLGHDRSGWDTLYRDPASGKLWEVT